MVKFGYGLCWRVLDAQHFGVPQRRRRVFVIGYLGNWRHSAAVLFEPESLCGNSKKGRGKSKRTSKNIEDGSDAQCALCGVVWDADGPIEACPVCGGMQEYIPKISDTIQTTANDYSRADGFCMLTQVVAKSFTIAEARKTGTIELKDQAPTLTSQTKRGDTEPCVLAFPERMSGTQRATTENLSPSLGAKNPTAIAQSMQVRRLTPQECERLQGFPDDWTNVSRNGKPAPDGPRYKAIGNSMAVPVMRWIGQRIQMVENVANG